MVSTTTSVAWCPSVETLNPSRSPMSWHSLPRIWPVTSKALISRSMAVWPRSDADPKQLISRSWWGEAPERPISLRGAYGLCGLIGEQCWYARRAVGPRMWQFRDQAGDF